MRHLALTFSMLLLSGGAHATDISFVTESYPPYVFQAKDGSVDGAGAAQVRAIMRDVGGDVRYTIEIMPWARAFALAETQASHCVFATARTPERENRFLWVAPMLTETTLIVSRSDAGIAASTTDEANDYSIGTQREDYTETLLRQAGFDRLDLSASFDLTLAKLLGGRVDLMAMSQGVYHKLVKDDVPIRSLLVLSNQELSIACNRTMPDGVVERMQASLDRIRASGEQDRIQERYDLPPLR